MWFGESEANVRDIFDKARYLKVSAFLMIRGRILRFETGQPPLAFFSLTNWTPSPNLAEEVLAMQEALRTELSTRSVEFL